ncbi:RNA polymerase sigma factor [Skermanella stibiiresistens]|nr:sigma-70 family RNA polymerase sigma factor [Skermanella stibiiresistens]
MTYANTAGSAFDSAIHSEPAAFPNQPHHAETPYRRLRSDGSHATNAPHANALHDAIRARFRSMYEEHRGYLHGLSLRWSAGNHAEAEDAVSDVFCRAVDVLSSGNTVILNERAWLGRMLHNRCVDRHRRRRLEAQEPLVLDHEGDVGDMAADHDNPLPTPETEILNRELGAVLECALDTLPDTLKGPLNMRLINGEPYGAIAERFGLSQANARKRVQQARELLRDRLAGYMTEMG